MKLAPGRRSPGAFRDSRACAPRRDFESPVAVRVTASPGAGLESFRVSRGRCCANVDAAAPKLLASDSRNVAFVATYRASPAIRFRRISEGFQNPRERPPSSAGQNAGNESATGTRSSSGIYEYIHWFLFARQSLNFENCLQRSNRDR